MLHPFVDENIVNPYRPRFFSRLLGACTVLTLCAVMVTAGAKFVLSEREGFAAFISTDQAAAASSSEPTPVFEDTVPGAPEVAPAPTTQESPTPATSTTTPAPIATTSSSTEVVEPEPDGLENMPPFAAPLSYGVLDAWTDGPSLITVWASSSEAADVDGLERYVVDLVGGWELTASGRIDDLLWARHSHPDHSWCLYIEVFEPGVEHRRLAERASLPGPQFLVAETPFCNASPGAFA